MHEKYKKELCGRMVLREKNIYHSEMNWISNLSKTNL